MLPLVEAHPNIDVIVFYLIAQMVGAGNLIKLMFGLSYENAIVIVGLVMIAYVLYHNESFLIHPNAPVWHHYQPFRWWLLPHGIAGACAILLGPRSADCDWVNGLEVTWIRRKMNMDLLAAFGDIIASRADVIFHVT